MKKLFVFILTTFFFLSSLQVFAFNGTGNHHTDKSFQLVGDTPIAISFETYKAGEGWTPVVLSLGELQVLLWMDGYGKLSEMRETFNTVNRSSQGSWYINTSQQYLYQDDCTLRFEVYEENDIRTRWRLSPVNHSGALLKQIIFKEHGIELGIDNLRLQLRHVFWKLEEKTPGIFQVQLYGSIPVLQDELIYDEVEDIIYSLHPWETNTAMEKKDAWAKSNQVTGPGSQRIGVNEYEKYYK